MPNETTSVQSDTEQLAMSTLSFQDYVRERMLRRQPTGEATGHSPAASPEAGELQTSAVPPMEGTGTGRGAGQANAPLPSAVHALPLFRATAEGGADDSASAATAVARLHEELRVERETLRLQELRARARAERIEQDRQVAPRQASASGIVLSATTGSAALGMPSPAAAGMPDATTLHTAALRMGTAEIQTTRAENLRLADELRMMKDMINTRLNTLSWFGQARQDPLRQSLMLALARGGFSSVLARKLLEKLPQGLDGPQALLWLQRVLAHNLRADSADQTLLSEGGVHVLVGPTGVGKTTTIAKLAGQHAVQHGPGSVGLISFDTSRPAALEQLRAQVQPFGVVAHEARSRHDLQSLLELFASRRLVLIDPAGYSPADPRLQELLASLELPFVNRIVVLNANSPQDTLEQVLRSFGSTQAMLTKIDETHRLAPALCALIGHRARLRGVCDGQRVADDWHLPDGAALVAQALAAGAQAARRTSREEPDEELSFYFAQDQGATAYAPAPAGHYAA